MDNDKADTGPDDEATKTDEPVDAPIVDIIEPKPAEKSGVGKGLVLACSSLAAVIGVTGGALLAPVIYDSLPWAQRVVIESTQASDDMKAQLENLETRTDNSVTRDELTALEARITTLESRNNEIGVSDVTDSALISRIEALEARPVSDGLTDGTSAVIDFSPIEARIADLETRVEAVSTSNESEAVVDPALMARVEALEAEFAQDDVINPIVDERLSALEVLEIPGPVDLTPIDARLNSLGEDLVALRTDFNAAVTARNAIPLPPFPRDEIIAAISAQSDDEGWLGRFMNKHVRVRDESLILIVDDIEALVLQGDAEAALARIEDLPQEGRQAARAWAEAVKIQRTSL